MCYMVENVNSFMSWLCYASLCMHCGFFIWYMHNVLCIVTLSWDMWYMHNGLCIKVLSCVEEHFFVILATFWWCQKGGEMYVMLWDIAYPLFLLWERFIWLYDMHCMSYELYMLKCHNHIFVLSSSKRRRLLELMS